jgi:hypothetical protein
LPLSLIHNPLTFSKSFEPCDISSYSSENVSSPSPIQIKFKSGTSCKISSGLYVLHPPPQTITALGHVFLIMGTNSLILA